MGGDLETEVAQNLRAEPVTQSDIFEPNQAQLRSMWATDGNPDHAGIALASRGREPHKVVVLRLWFPIR